MSVARVLVPFSAGVAVGVLLHKYWPEIRLAGGPAFAASLNQGSEFVEKGRTAFWEKSERFADVIAEIRDDEATALAGGAAGPKAPRPPSTTGGGTSGSGTGLT